MSQTLEIDKLVVISTRHLTEATAKDARRETKH